jgi:hypothetical protein
MPTLSEVRGENMLHYVIANSLVLTSPLRIQNGAMVTFQIFKRKAASLDRYIGKPTLFALDGRHFWGELKSLEPCEDTIYRESPALHSRPTLCASIAIIGPETLKTGDSPT